MKTLLILAIVGVTAYVATKSEMPVFSGIKNFVTRTAPAYAREKLSIRENPVTKRAKIIDELTIMKDIITDKSSLCDFLLKILFIVTYGQFNFAVSQGS